MIDYVGEQLAGCCLGLDALQELIPRRAQELDLHERKALVEGVEDRRFAFRHVSAVEDEFALLPRGLDQLRWAELRGRGRTSENGERRDDGFDHRVTAGTHRPCSTLRPIGRAASRTARSSAPTA